MGARRPKKRHPTRERTQVDRQPRLREQRPARTGRLGLLPVLIIVAGVAAYFNSFAGVFLLDDTNHILDNERIRHLWPVWDLLACRRPVVELSLAVNYALGGYDVWGYHLFNLTVHILAALTLYGIVRRTLMCGVLRDRFGSASSRLALIASVIWVVHPLQTQSVNYIIQRGESLMGLFYLLTLYCMIRSVDSLRYRWWYAAAIIAGVLGMGSKAVMVTAPVVVLLYDRAFLSKSFAEVLRRRWALYAGLAATWLVLVLCGVVQGVLDSSRRFATVGLSFRDVTPVQYALTQPGAILQYLKLAIWPHPLCLDYGFDVAGTVGAIAGPAIIVTALLAATIWALVRRPSIGFLGVWFFVILVPTSSFIPIQDLIFEHRMYLSLAGVVTLFVVAGYSAVTRLFREGPLRRVIGGGLVVVIVSTLGYMAIRRNEDYHSNIHMWQDVLAKRPNSARAHHNLASALSHEGRFGEAVEAYRTAIRLGAKNAKAYANLGLALMMEGNLAEAEEHLRNAVRVKPGFVEARVNLGNVLRQSGRSDEAIAEYRGALRLRPSSAEAQTNLGVALADVGQFEEGIRAAQRAVQIRKDFPEGYVNLGLTLTKAGRAGEAVEAYREALRLNPQYAEAHANLGLALGAQGRVDEAMEEFRAALRIRPDYAEPHHHLGFALMRQGRMDEAIEEFRTALQIRPRYAEAHYKLGNALAQQNRFDQAITAYRSALDIAPRHAEAHAMLAIALARSGLHAQATEEFRAAIRLRPGLARWHTNLGHALVAQGRLDEAESAYRDAIRLKPDFADAHYDLGTTLQRLNRVDEAEGEFREALRINPQLDRVRQSLDALLAEPGGSTTP